MTAEATSQTSEKPRIGPQTYAKLDRSYRLAFKELEEVEERLRAVRTLLERNHGQLQEYREKATLESVQSVAILTADYAGWIYWPAKRLAGILADFNFAVPGAHAKVVKRNWKRFFGMKE